MLKKLVTLLAFLLLTLALAGRAMADGIIIPVPPPRPGPGPVTPALRSLAIKYHRVEVTIVDQVATTRVDQVFLNETGREIEGEYIFPIPEGASVSQFALWVDGEPVLARVLDRDEARRIYEDIVRRQQDPALLEYAGRGAFRARIYPIPARGERRVQLEYSQVLPLEHDLVRYVYPLNTEKFSSRPIEDVRVSVRIKGQRSILSVYSPSHDVAVERAHDRSAQVDYAAQDVLPDQDFVLYYSVGSQDLGMTLLSYRDLGEDGYFLLLLSPSVESDTRELVSKDVLFVVDTSGSMRGEKLAQAKGAARYVLEHLQSEDRFNIVSFSSGVRRYSRESRPASERERGYKFVTGLRAGGGTNIERALKVALSQTQSHRPQVVLFLTDGIPTEGEQSIEGLVDLVSARSGSNLRLFTFGVGYDVNTTLLDLISREHRGTSSYVRPSEDIEGVVSSFYDTISSPVLSSTTLDFGDANVSDVFPYPLPDVFAGGQLVVVGRYSEAVRTTLRLGGTVNGVPTELAFKGAEFLGRGGEDLIPRLWATRKIGHLLTQIRLHGADRELVDEVVELSVRYGIVTPYTSFLVDETEDAVRPSTRREGAAESPAYDAQALPRAGEAGGRGGAAAPSGRVEVEKSIAEKALKGARVAPTEAPEVLRAIGNTTFVLRGRVWVDTRFVRADGRAYRIQYGSDEYFRLAAAHPEWSRFLALGQQVIFHWDGEAVEIGSEGKWYSKLTSLAVPGPASPSADAPRTGDTPSSGAGALTDEAFWRLVSDYQARMAR